MQLLNAANSDNDFSKFMNYIEPPISSIKIKDEDEYKKGHRHRLFLYSNLKLCFQKSS